jgi:oligosaccharyltransferase complex subunit beta
MRLTKTFLSLLALVSSAVVEARSSTGQRVLVVIEHALNRAEYSKFWDSLQGKSRKKHEMENDKMKL